MDEISIEGHEIRRLLDRAQESASGILQGLHLDDGQSEWLVEGLIDNKLCLVRLHSDGITATNVRRQLPASGISDDYVLFGEPGQPGFEEMLAATMSSLDIIIDRSIRLLQSKGLPQAASLGARAMDVAVVYEKLQTASDVMEEDLDKFTEIIERSQDQALWGANILKAFMAHESNDNPALIARCRIHISALFRKAGRFMDAIAATDVLVRNETKGMTQGAICAMSITRAAALMDKFDSNRMADPTRQSLEDAKRYLSRAFAIRGGESDEFLNATYGRLNSIEKQVKADE